MRLLVWNCGGAMHKKLHVIDETGPDIAILIETYAPERIPQMGFSSSAWCGRLSYKGLGVFGFGDWSVEQSQPVDERLEYILPTTVQGPAGQRFDIFAVWAQNHRARAHYDGCRYVPQATVMLEKMEVAPRDRPTIVAGDFNHSAVFDTERRPAFSEMAEAFAHAGLESVFHRSTGEPFGNESRPTHWWRDRTVDGPRFHLDYLWASKELATGGELTVATFDEAVTTGGSDHAWLVYDIEPSQGRSIG